ncbi:hypothetical protein CJO09_00980 [Neopusillimonas maritima]|uniref:Peptidase S74 domain-containing protein n=2 Tax=Neopusillimonas maritima TaxID=2026239 RepID=A0ABX9MY20_9BURK|nr:hypothetical protein CJO09_00980 [Neopusillimonas maritima]
MDSNIAREVDKARVDIINALGRQTSSLSGQTAQAVETQTRHAEELAKAGRKIDSIIKRSNVTCGSASGSQSSSMTMVSRKQTTEPLSTGSKIPPRLKKAWDQSDPNASVLPPFDQNVAAADFGFGSCQGFAGDPNSMRGQLCRSVQGLQIKSNKYADADIRAETLFHGPQEKEKGRVQLTVTAQHSSAERDARKSILASLSQPVPPPGVRPTALASPEGLAYVGQLTEHQAKMSLATEPIRDWDVATTASPESFETLRALLNDNITAVFLEKKLNKEFPEWAQEGVSPLHLSALQVEKRAGNPDWYTYMAGADDVAKSAEVPLILAEQQRLLFSILLELKKLNVVNGQQLAEDVQENNMPRLERLAEAANRTIRNQ